jgi:hypothetical protein
MVAGGMFRERCQWRGLATDMQVGVRRVYQEFIPVPSCTLWLSGQRYAFALVDLADYQLCVRP